MRRTQIDSRDHKARPLPDSASALRAQLARQGIDPDAPSGRWLARLLDEGERSVQENVAREGT